MLRTTLAALALLVLLCAQARGQSPQAKLGRLEQESVDEAMGSLGQAIDPAPQGKTIGRVVVVNQDVFSKRDWWFQWFNHFHRTTRDYIMERELLVKPGQLYDQALVEETMRNLQTQPPIVVAGRTVFQPDLSSVVVILPVRSTLPGQVDVLVVTRDIWSLRFNTDFDLQQSTLAFLATSLSENNLFGWRKFVSFGFSLDQGAYWFGPTYVDPNIHGTRLTLYTSAALYYGRDTGDYEGNAETLSLRRPLYSLASRWGGGVDFVHLDNVIRSFQGTALRPVDLPGTPGLDNIPYIYRRRTTTVDGNVVRSFDSPRVIQRVTAGYRVQARRSDVLPDFAFDAATAQAFLKLVSPISEDRSGPYVAYEVFTPRYAVYRDLDTFDLRENRRLGPRVALSLSYGVPELGADLRAVGLGATASWAVGPAGWYGFAALVGSTRRWNGSFIDQLGSAQIYAATPLIAGLGRVVVEGEIDGTRNDTQATRFVLGGRTGLRGYAIGDFFGPVAAVGHAEIRTAPVPVFSQRFGGLLFYDVGNAAPSFAELVAYHDFGIGLRWLIPQLNSSVVRVDWAIATQSTTTLTPPGLTRAGLPGRVTAGFQQTF